MKSSLRWYFDESSSSDVVWADDNVSSSVLKNESQNNTIHSKKLVVAIKINACTFVVIQSHCLAKKMVKSFVDKHFPRPGNRAEILKDAIYLDVF